MKRNVTHFVQRTRRAFSTLDSGLRDETHPSAELHRLLVAFSTLDSGLRDETRRRSHGQRS